MSGRIPPVPVLVSRILILAGLAVCGSVLRADVIYSNFGTDFSYTDQTAVVVTNGISDLSVAEEFTPANNYDLTSIEFVASVGRGDQDPSNWVEVSIFSDNNGVPGAELDSITLNGELAQFDGTLSPVLTANSTSNSPLSAGTSYWLVMDGSAAESLNWDQNSTGTFGLIETDGTPGNYPIGSNPNALETNGVFEVDGTLVSGGSLAQAPEPGTWLLMIAGMGTIAFVRQGRR